jgi:hypothetical protein
MTRIFQQVESLAFAATVSLANCSGMVKVDQPNKHPHVVGEADLGDWFGG